MPAVVLQNMRLNIQHMAWLMYSLLAMSYLVAYFHRVAPAVVLDYLIADLGITDAAVAGALAGMYAIIYMIMQIPSGLLADFWGPRRTVFTGMMVTALGTLLFALAPGLVSAFVGRALVGLGVSVILVSVLKFQIAWFRPEQFATMGGLNAVAGNLGGALGTTPLAFLVEGFGWRNSFLLAAGFTFLVAVSCWLLVRDTPGIFQGERKLLSFLPDKKEKKERPAWQDFASALKKVFKNQRNWPLFTTFMAIYGTLIAFTGTWSVSYLMQVYGFSRGEASGYMLLVTLGMIAGGPLVGLFSDRLARRRMPLLVLFVLYTSLWALLMLWNGGRPPEAALYPVFFFMGFFCTLVVIIPPLTKEVNELSHSGTAIGLVNVGPFAGMAILQPLLGFVLDLRWEGEVMEGVRVYPLEAYQLLFTTCLGILLVSFVVALRIRETCCRNIFGDEEGQGIEE